MILASSFFSILYIVLGIFAVLALGGLSGKERKERTKKLEWSDVDIRYRDLPDPLASDTFSTYVGGARFYADSGDLRAFVGFVIYTPDEEAPRIYRNDLKMLGHIPRERLHEYNMWSQGETFPCAGFVVRGNDYETLASEIKIIKPYNHNYVEREIKRFIGWVVMTHGHQVELIPPDYSPLLAPEEIHKIRKQRKDMGDNISSQMRQSGLSPLYKSRKKSIINLE